MCQPTSWTWRAEPSCAGGNLRRRSAYDGRNGLGGRLESGGRLPAREAGRMAFRRPFHRARQHRERRLQAELRRDVREVRQRPHWRMGRQVALPLRQPAGNGHKRLVTQTRRRFHGLGVHAQAWHQHVVRCCPAEVGALHRRRAALQGSRRPFAPWRHTVPHFRQSLVSAVDIAAGVIKEGEH